MKEKNILEYIVENKRGMTKKQQHLSNFILENHEDIGLMTVTELADKADVGKTTILRFVQELGLNSFFDLKKEFHKIQKDYSDKWKNVQLSFQEDSDNSIANTLYKVWQERMRVLDDSLNPGLVEGFEKAIHLLKDSSTINLLGFRPYISLAMYTESLIGEFDANVRQLAIDPDAILDRLMLLSTEDVIVIIAFSPYSTRVIDAAQLAHEKNIPVILITEELSNPMSEYATVLLKLESSNKYFTAVSIITLIEALVVELGRHKAPDSIDNIKNLSNILKEKGYITE